MVSSNHCNMRVAFNLGEKQKKTKVSESDSLLRNPTYALVWISVYGHSHVCLHSQSWELILRMSSDSVKEQMLYAPSHNPAQLMPPKPP